MSFVSTWVHRSWPAESHAISGAHLISPLLRELECFPRGDWPVCRAEHVVFRPEQLLPGGSGWPGWKLRGVLPSGSPLPSSCLWVPLRAPYWSSLIQATVILEPCLGFLVVLPAWDLSMVARVASIELQLSMSYRSAQNHLWLPIAVNAEIQGPVPTMLFLMGPCLASLLFSPSLSCWSIYSSGSLIFLFAPVAFTFLLYSALPQDIGTCFSFCQKCSSPGNSVTAPPAFFKAWAVRLLA